MERTSRVQRWSSVGATGIAFVVLAVVAACDEPTAPDGDPVRRGDAGPVAPDGGATTYVDAGTAYGYDAGPPTACAGGTYGADRPADPDALLWSSRGGWPVWDYCRCRPDATPLPVDARTLIEPDVDAGRAVAFNMRWRDCHVDPVAVQERGALATCGELRASVARGASLMTPGSRGVGALFSGDQPNTLASGFGIATFPAASYNQMWRSWGMIRRPDNFDELVAERVGTGFGPTPNPYPLPGEDPNETNGGSGRLPVFFTQMRKPDGRWSGTIGITCQGCHSGIVGSATDGEGLGLLEGSGSPLADHDLFLRDMLPLGYMASFATLANLSQVRGANNASDVNLAFFFPDEELYDARTLLGLITSGSTAGIDTPAWWNMGHRTVKFVDGIFPMDSPRVDMVFYTPFVGILGGLLGPLSEQGQDWMRAHGPDANDWATVLKSPEYPYAIDEDLAEEGAVLFHTLDLWEGGRHNPIRDPEAGNGSCASCHGAYAPRYFNDPTFLASPALEGIAAYATPLDVIGTDAVRIETNNEAVQVAGSVNFFGYPETKGTADDCGPQNQERLLEGREIGYVAQPLYGVWATAPYFHNGSVPNLAAVLDTGERPRIWRRWSTPARADQEGRVVMGFDTNLARAFDPVSVGWRYDVIPCERQGLFEPDVTPYLECIPGSDEDPLVQQLLAGLFSNVVAAWNILEPPDFTRTQIEERKIYNTHMFGQGNGGHAFSDVLTDHERLAIIEYLKTL